MQAFNWESERQKDTDTDAHMDRGLRLQEIVRYRYTQC